MTETAGLDFSDARPDPQALAGAGFRLIIGYLKPLWSDGTRNTKELTAADLAAYTGAGLAVATVYESTGDTWTGSASAGVSDADIAVGRAQVIGYPRGCPIFGAVDSDPSADLATALAYLVGFVDRVNAAGWVGGGYGSRALVDALAAVRPQSLRWQTAGWSGGVLSPAAHLYQRATPSGHWPVIPGTDEDVVCAPFHALGGLLTPGGGAAIPSTPAPAPEPAPAFDTTGYVRQLRGQRGDTGAVWQLVQEWGNDTFGAYCAIDPTAPVYGPRTAAFLAELAHRAAVDPALPGSINRTALRNADGENVGPNLSAAMVFYGLPGYLSRAGFSG